jgi:hypothetical protein
MSGRQSGGSDQRATLMAASDTDLLAAVSSMTRTYNVSGECTLPVADPHSTLGNKDCAGKQTHSVLKVNLLLPTSSTANPHPR